MPKKRKPSFVPDNFDCETEGLEVEAYDNTRIEDHCKCERKGYFRHVRGFAPDKPGKSLVFGSSWHKAMDAIWSKICWDEVYDIPKVAEAGIEAFLESWISEGFPDVDEWTHWDKQMQKDLSPQTPLVAMEMIYEYISARMKWLQGIELLEIERPFIVPLFPDNPSIMYSGKMDKTYRRDSRIYGLDHKTTSLYSKVGFFRPLYLNGFNPNRQLDGYLHAVKMEYGKIAKALWVDCALVHANVHDGFRFIPVELQVEHLDAWLWETTERIADIRRNDAMLKEQRENDPGCSILKAFPKKTEACTLYNRECEYMDLCNVWANPELHIEVVPDGFKIDFWSPFSEQQLAKLGLKEKK